MDTEHPEAGPSSKISSARPTGTLSSQSTPVKRDHNARRTAQRALQANVREENAQKNRGSKRKEPDDDGEPDEDKSYTGGRKAVDDDKEWREKRASGKKKKVDHGQSVKEKKSTLTPRRSKANTTVRNPTTPVTAVSSGPSVTTLLPQGTPPTTPSLKIRLPRLGAVLSSNTSSPPQPSSISTLHTPRSNGRQRLASVNSSSADAVHPPVDPSKSDASKFPNPVP
jgi:hypothetical protein